MDYKDRFSVFSSLARQVSEIDDITFHLETIYSIKNLADRYKYFCSLDESVILSLLPHLPESFTNYYTVLGVSRMIALGYNATNMKREYDGIVGNQEIDISTIIHKSFTVGEKMSKCDVKNKLRDLYNSVGYSKTPRAVDLGDYFIIKNCKIPKADGTRDNGYEIIAIKT